MVLGAFVVVFSFIDNEPDADILNRESPSLVSSLALCVEVVKPALEPILTNGSTCGNSAGAAVVVEDSSLTPSATPEREPPFVSMRPSLEALDVARPLLEPFDLSFFGPPSTIFSTILTIFSAVCEATLMIELSPEFLPISSWPD